MQIILFLNKDAEVLNAVHHIKLEHHRIVTLENEKFFRHYLEEYIPTYVIASYDIDAIESIIEFTRSYSNARLIITCAGRPGVKANDLSLINDREILFLGNISDLNSYKKVLNTIDDISNHEGSDSISLPGSLKTDKEAEFINQQVVSVFSLQGGIGKTALASNVACFFGKTRKVRILLVDLNFAEGSSDLSLKMRLPQYPNLCTFMEKIHESHSALNESVMKIRELNIDILLPPVSLFQSDKLDTELLNSLIFTARSVYNYIIVDLPCRFDNVFIEMLNLSTIVLFLTGPDPQQVLKPRNYLKFLPLEQRRGLVINHVNEMPGFDIKDINFIAEMPVFGVIPLIKRNGMTFLSIGREKTDIIDLQPFIIDLINWIILT